jgi:hypothetical protein
VPQLAPQPVSRRATFSGYCAQKQIAVLRAAAGVPSYLNDVTLRRLLARSHPALTLVLSLPSKRSSRTRTSACAASGRSGMRHTLPPLG